MLAKIISKKIDESSAMPKYLQLSEKILNAWISGKVREGELLPSLHDFSTILWFSRGTVEKAYTILKKRVYWLPILAKVIVFRKKSALPYWKVSRLQLRGSQIDRTPIYWVY